MTKNNGWIKLHRKLLDSSIAGKPNYISVWITLLLLANHTEKTILWNGEKLKIECGQVLTGRKKLSKETGVAPTTLERILDNLEQIGKIGQQKTNKFRLISIKKWTLYQEMDNKRTTSGHQADTNKKDKNDKNILPVKTGVVFSSKDTVRKYMNSKQRHIHLIGLYWNYLDVKFDNPAQVQAQLKRNLRGATNLVGYTDKQIVDTMRLLDKESDMGRKFKWTLETIIKYL